MTKDSKRCYLHAYDPENTECMRCVLAESCRDTCYPDGLPEGKGPTDDIESLPPAKRKRPVVRDAWTTGKGWHNLPCKRTILIGMLLTGRTMDRHELVAGITSRFPRHSLIFTNTFITSHVRFLFEMGIIEAIGETQIRVRPEVLAVLRGEG